MKRILLLLCALLLMPLCASAVVTVPGGIVEIGPEAFANTAADALIVPSSVKTVGANVLAGCDASYIFIVSSATVLESGAANGVPFVFGPSASGASGLDGFYPAETLVINGGLYYSVTDTALPLCAKSPAETTGVVTIPKLLTGKPVTTLSELYIGNTGVTELRVPRYLEAPEGIPAVTYQTMTAAAPVPGVNEIPAGKYVTWTTEGATGAYGGVTYTWTFVSGDVTDTLITTDPTIKYAPMTKGECHVTVKVTDSLGDWAEASSVLTVTDPQPTYRALLIGNTYPGASNALKGPDNDVAAMVTMLNGMPGTPYKITTAKNLTATGIQHGAIPSAFAGAEPGDVSLFYYSGHGTEAGALVGVNNTYLTVYGLRTALQKIPGTKIVILDCCYSGQAINKSGGTQEVDLNAFNRAMIGGLTAQPRSSENLADGGFIVLTACRKDQQSVSLTGDGSIYWGVFTYGLCYGSGYDEWTGKSLGYLPADSNGSGSISLGEAWQGVRERVNYLNTMYYLEQAVQYHGDTSFVLWKK